MNSLAQLIDDLDLDEALVLKCLIRHGLVSPSCRSVSEVANSDCHAAVELVMDTLRQDVKRAKEMLNRPHAHSGGGGR